MFLYVILRYIQSGRLGLIVQDCVRLSRETD